MSQLLPTPSRRLHWVFLSALLAGTAAVLPGRDEPPVEKKPAEKPMRVEEEDESFKPGKPVLRVEEPEVVEKISRRFPRPAADLKQAVLETKSGVLRKAYLNLEVPHDLVYYVGSSREEYVLPLDEYVGEKAPSTKGTLDVTPYLANWKPGKQRAVGAASVEKVRHYEQLARDAVVELLANDKEVLKQDRLIGAEQILSAALTFHDAARKGDSWKDLSNDLRKKLLDVQLDQVREAGEVKDWNEAAELGRRLTDKFYPAEADQVRIAVVLADLLSKALNEPSVKTARLREVRQQVRLTVDHYMGNSSAQGVATSLSQQAGSLLTKAEQAMKDKELARAEELVQQATELDPQSQRLRDLRAQLNQFYPVLRVGVRALPQLLSPARATTDAELRAVELLFEGLVKMVPGPDGAARFRPALAETRPRTVPLGRDFLLPRHAVWAGKIGQPEKTVTAADVSYSLAKLKEGQGGMPRTTGDLFNDITIGDGNRVTLTLVRGHLDPLALMTFKIIPEKAKASDDDFAKAPVGSGPYRLGEPGKDALGEYVSFLSNAAYGTRPGRTGLPHIREIRFYVTKDPVKEMKEGRLDMALDLTAAQAATLEKDAKILAPPPGPNRRVYFLAVNHVPGHVLSNANFRRGLALAINREELLNEHFRKGLDRPVHKALNSPFPYASWPSKPVAAAKSLDPYDAKLAESKLAEGRSGKAELSLKYPVNDPKLAEALIALCKDRPAGDPKIGDGLSTLRKQHPGPDWQLIDALYDLRKQILLLTKDGVALDPVPLTPYDLRKAVEERNYQLAYWHYDFPDETYSLSPLLGQEGNNVMQYRGGELQNLIREAAVRREFDKVREEMRAMHTELNKDMPLIPLWQLDPLSAYRQDLKPTYYDRTMGLRKDVERVPYDPLLVFTDAENWRLERQ